MHRLDYKAFVTSRRDERDLSHHTLRAYAQDLRTFSDYAEQNQISNPISRDDILGYHRHLRDSVGATPATIQRRLCTLKAYFAWRASWKATFPSPFDDLRISVRIPRRLPRPVDRDTLKAVLHPDAATTGARPAVQTSCAMQDVTIPMRALMSGFRQSCRTAVSTQFTMSQMLRGKKDRPRISIGQKLSCSAKAKITTPSPNHWAKVKA